MDFTKDLIDRAIQEYKPYATVAMFSGGTDSLTALHAVLNAGHTPDYVVFVNTGTGIQDTVDYVRRYIAQLGLPYLEGEAGNAYEDYVMRKGFFGRGRTAHTYAYHLLKAGIFRKVISHNIRKGKHGRNVLMFNGARLQESANRKINLPEPINVDPGNKRNIWVNVIHTWSKRNCLDFLEDVGAEINPVSELLHRSGECMCGTMQSEEERKEAALWFPEWGKWLDDLESRVIDRGFNWGWGENVPPAKERTTPCEEFTPMCHDCTHGR